MSHDGSFDRLVSSRVFSVGWRMLIHCPKTLGARWFEKSADVCPTVRNGSTSHNGVGPGGVGNAQSVTATSIVLRLSLLRHRHAVPLKSPATINFLRNRKGTKSETELLGDAFLFGVDVADM